MGEADDTSYDVGVLRVSKMPDGPAIWERVREASNFPRAPHQPRAYRLSRNSTKKTGAFVFARPKFLGNPGLLWIDRQERFWMIDAQTKKALFVNQAYETITGRSCESLRENPTSYEELIHAEDRVHVLAKLDEATRTGQFNERFRIVCSHGEVRWVWVRGFPVKDAEGKIRRLVGTALEITAQKQAEEQVMANLEIGKSAWAEAEALRKATLSLTQDLRMDFIMETLLSSLEELVPYTCARVLVPEGGPHMLALGERRCPEQPKEPWPRAPLTFVADESTFFHQILTEQKSVLIGDTRTEATWHTFKGHKQIQLQSILVFCQPLTSC